MPGAGKREIDKGSPGDVIYDSFQGMRCEGFQRVFRLVGAIESRSASLPSLQKQLVKASIPDPPATPTTIWTT